MKGSVAVLPPFVVLDQGLQDWLREDIGRGDRTTLALLSASTLLGKARWVAKSPGIVAGLPVAARVFQLVNNNVNFIPVVAEGAFCQPGEVVAEIEGGLDALLMAERVALNLAMRLSGIATATREYVEKIGELPTQFVDTRKTTPGLRVLEKYASQVGGARNHRMGLDDAVMIKDNHIRVAGGIQNAIALIRQSIPYPLRIEVETSSLEEVEEAIGEEAEIIMLDNMNIEQMQTAVKMIRQHNKRILIEASGNITLDNIEAIAQTGVDFISSSAPVTRSSWLDLSMQFDQE
jgi:nicotinate-nucleotide pyrophosphorylase (carboxylating)